MSVRDLVGAGLLVLATAGIAAVAAEPRTQADVVRQEHAWLIGTFRGDFEAHGKKDAPWADAYREFLDAWAEFIYGPRAPDTLERLEARVAELVAAGCDDPVFGLLRGWVHRARRQPQEALEVFARLEDLQRSDYPSLYACFAMHWARQLKAELKLPGAGGPNPDKPLHDLTVATARDPSFAADCQWIYLKYFQNDNDFFLTATADLIAKDNDGIDPWIAAMVLGRDHVRKAWKARGGGVADTVTPEGWQGFHEHLAAAREHFTRAHELHPEFPDAAGDMITVSLGDGSGEARLWFDRAVAAQFDFIPAYGRMVGQVLLPRWGGSHEQMLAFGRECLATGRFDTGVPYYCFAAVLEVGRELEAVRDAVALPGAYDDCVRVCRGYIAFNRDAEAVREMRSRLAIVHWAAGRHAEACKELDALGDQLVQLALTDFQVPADDVVGESRLLGGPDGAAFAAAEALIERGKVTEALAAYEPLAARGGRPPAAERIVASRLKTLRNAVALDRHEWVDLVPAADLAGWRKVFGTWQVDGDGGLVATDFERGRAKMLWENEPGQDLEVMAEFDFSQRLGRFQGSILVAHAAGRDEHNFAIGVQVDLASQQVLVGYQGDPGLWFNAPETIKKQGVAVTDRTLLRIVMWDAKMSVFVNGAKVVDKVALPQRWLQGGGLGISDSVRMRIRTLRVRTLDEAPEDM